MITTTECRISPDVARHILETTANKGFYNRQEREQVIKRYAEDMRRGRWRETGETIKMTSDGKLIDGFHRLKAIILSGVTINLLVANNVPEDSFVVFDSGQKRTHADTLFIKGYQKYTRTITSTAKTLIHFVKRKEFPSYATPLSFTFEEIEATVSKFHQPLEDAACFYARRSRKVISQAVMMTLMVIFSFVEQEKAEKFFELVIDGENIDKFHPCWHLRNFLIEHRSKKQHTLKREFEAANVIIAWNAFYADKPMRLLRWTPANGFPLVAGFNYENFL